MPTYARRCRSCSLELECHHPIAEGCDCPGQACPNCGGPILRVFGVNYPKASSFQPHYNRSIGMYVNTRQQFLDGLKAGSEAASARLGMDHDYQPIDHPSEVPGVSEEGTESTLRQRRNSGVDQPKKTVIA